MRDSVRSSSTRDHSVQFYEDDGYLCGQVGMYLGAGLDQGAVALIIATERHRRGIAAALHRSGYDLEALRASGQVIELGAEEILDRFMDGGLRYGIPDARSFDRIVGRLVEGVLVGERYRGIVAYGEIVGLLAERGNLTAALKLEELCNDLRRKYPFQLFCGYAMSSFGRSQDTESFRRICALHEHVLPVRDHGDHDTGSAVDNERRELAELVQRAGALEAEIGERKRLEQALREEHARLEEAGRRKDDFISVLSHELRNPLAPILTALDLMDLRGESTSRREREIIRRQARHLAALVEDLLDLSRVASGKISLQRHLVEFATIADAALEMTAPLFEERRHTLELSVPDHGLLLEADPVRLPQAVANLLTNAAKFTRAQGHVSLIARREASDIVVVVEDDGPGIPVESLNDIFAPFAQARQGIDRAAGGLGLGLTLARSITELHGGTAVAHSEGPGKGSRFTLRLPAAKARDTVSARHRRKRAEPLSRRLKDSPRTSADPTFRRVLIVDDNRDAAQTMSRLIAELGFEARIAHDGPQALAIAASFAPETALIDIGLPGMDGYSLARRLRGLRDGAALRLIAVTGYSQATDRAKSRLAGFDAHLVKPVTHEMLRSFLAEPRIPSDSHLA